MSSAGYVPRHSAGLLAGAAKRARDRRDYVNAQTACVAVDTAESLLLGLMLSSWRARQVQHEQAAA